MAGQITNSDDKRRYHNGRRNPRWDFLVQMVTFSNLLARKVPSQGSYQQQRQIARVQKKSHSFWDFPFAFWACVWATVLWASFVQASDHSFPSTIPHSTFSWPRITFCCSWMCRMLHCLMAPPYTRVWLDKTNQRRRQPTKEQERQNFVTPKQVQFVILG